MRVHERVGGAPRALHRPAVCVERDREELQREPLPDSIALLWIRRKYFEGRTKLTGSFTGWGTKRVIGVSLVGGTDCMVVADSTNPAITLSIDKSKSRGVVPDAITTIFVILDSLR